MQTYERHGKAKLTATIISVIVVAGVVALADHLKADQAAMNSTLTAHSSTPSSSGTSGGSRAGTGSSGSTASSFKDGTYTATNDYLVPAGQQSIEVNLTLKGGAITGVSVQNSESDPTSALFQQDFASAIKSHVVGKKISGLQLGVVAGASDTTQAFDSALSQIASKAQG